jgi:SAM-dependent methyltransferase
MDPQLKQHLGSSWAAGASTYAAHRPGYPPECVEFLAASTPVDVLDLAAGAGALTSSLAAAGHRVIAVDLSRDMLVELRRSTPDMPAAVAIAEQLPFRPATFDAVTVATAFHWFDADRSLPEIARTLRPGGRLGLAWQIRDRSVEWVRRLGELLRAVQPIGLVGDWATDCHRSLGESGYFEDVEYAEFGWRQPLDRDGLLGLVASRSYVVTLAARRRSTLLRAVSRLYDETLAAQRQPMQMPYRTRCWRATRR